VVAVADGLGVLVGVAVGTFVIAPPQAAKARPASAAAGAKRERRTLLNSIVLPGCQPDPKARV